MIISSHSRTNSQDSKYKTEQFTLLSFKQTGVTFNNKITEDKEKNILLYANYYGGAGIGIGDFNNDGLEDIYFAGNLVADELYINQGNFKFKNRTKQAGIIDDGGWSTGVTVADVNNDGLLDIYVSKELYDNKPELRRNKLYINQGNAIFKEMSKEYKIDNSERTRHAVFFDYDKDGFLDLFILNQPPNPGSYSEYFGTKLLQPQYTSRLYRNIAGVKFIDVTKISGLANTGFPNAVSASDLNNDGWIDLYVANDFYAPDFMYINNKDGTFSNIANKALSHMSFYSMGVDVADINNDNNLDIFTVDMSPQDNFRLKSNMSGMNPKAFWNVVNNGGNYQYMYNNLHLNNGNNTYSEIAQLSNIASTDWSWSNLIADFNNDGEKDIYITNGLLRDIRNTDASKEVANFVVEIANNWVKQNPDGGDISIWDVLDLKKTLAILPSEKLANFMYINKGDYIFNKVTSKWGLDQKSFSNGSAYADLDNDGDLDLIVNNINDKAFIYKNNSKNNYLRLELKSKTHKPVFGTRVIIKINDKKQVFETTNVRGIYSTSEQYVHFGLGDNNKVKEAKIIWNNGTQTLLKNVKANQKLDVFIEEGEKLNNVESNNESTLLFSEITDSINIKYKHIENKYDDYKEQLLLPHKMSQFGPALAIADVNNDGLEDIFVGAATGFTPKIFFQKSLDEFVISYNIVFEEDKIHEDIDATFFDVDNDGDQDLYVVSGGNEFENEHENYKDRLYLNNGKGEFSKSNFLEFSNFSGSIVTTTDFDNDGDIDVFVRGRHLPHKYPLPADSKLLENVNGKLIDVTKKIASDLKDIGLVTDAIWTDYDGDNDDDLMIVGEWMSLTIFENKEGVFSKLITPSFNNTKGWWFSIEQGDFDNDGDIDYIAGNLGLNYKYKASIEKPFDVYYKDFDDNGKEDIVLGYYNYGKHYPVRGFSCSSNQVPGLKQSIKKYAVFASMEISDVYGNENLSNAFHLKADTFETSFIENLGNGNFKLSKLPVEAQFSSVNDILVNDFNDDGNLDVLLVGNLFVSEIETPKNDAGTGLLLLGNGKNEFKPLTHFESGFFVNNDAKKIKMLKNNKKVKQIFVANNNNFLQSFKVKVN